MKTLFTVGYEGTDIVQFIETLSANKIRALADLRAFPVSRKRGFSKNALRQALDSAGIEYFHFVDLGDPKEGRDAARAGDYDRFRNIFGKHLRSDNAQAALGELRRLAASKRTCLMCFERDPSNCHRSIVALGLIGRGMSRSDLYCKLQNRHVRQPLQSCDLNQGRPAAQ